MPKLSASDAPCQVLPILQPCSERWKHKLHGAMGKAWGLNKSYVFLNVRQVCIAPGCS